jgi:hypothetical protein
MDRTRDDVVPFERARERPWWHIAGQWWVSRSLGIWLSVLSASGASKEVGHSRFRGTHRFRRPLHNGRTSAGTRHSYRGSISEVGRRFKSCRISDLEMVAQIFPRWNRVADWLKEAERFSTAA